MTSPADNRPTDRADSADSASESFVTVNPDGTIKYTFAGKINAKGLVLDEVDTTSVTAANRIEWDDAAGAVWQRITGSSSIGNDPSSLLELRADAITTPGAALVRALAKAFGAGPLRAKTILDSANKSSFYVLPTDGLTPVGNSGDLLNSLGAGVLPAFTSPANLKLYVLPAAGSIGAGNAGDVLTSNGAGVNPSMQAPAGIALTSGVNKLGADVAMTNANQFYDGPAGTLTAGTWLLVGAVQVTQGAGGGGAFTAKIWDGTTVSASAEDTVTQSAHASIPLAAIVSPGSTTTYKISVTSTRAAATLRAAAVDNGAGLNASYLTAVKIA